MEKVFVRSWRALALRGVVSLACGIVALVWPAIALSGLVVFVGAYALLDGLLTLGSATRPDVTTRIHLLVLEAFVSIGVGVAALLWTSMTTVVLVMLIGFWAILTGILELVLAHRLRGKIPGDTLLAIAGASSLIAGMVMLLWPQVSALFLVVCLGAYGIFFGTTMLVLALLLRQATDFPGLRPRFRPKHQLGG